MITYLTNFTTFGQNIELFNAFKVTKLKKLKLLTAFKIQNCIIFLLKKTRENKQLIMYTYNYNFLLGKRFDNEFIQSLFHLLYQ